MQQLAIDLIFSYLYNMTHFFILFTHLHMLLQSPLLVFLEGLVAQGAELGARQVRVNVEHQFLTLVNL